MATALDGVLESKLDASKCIVRGNVKGIAVFESSILVLTVPPSFQTPFDASMWEESKGGV